MMTVTADCLESAALPFTAQIVPAPDGTRPRSIRLFENPFLELATRAHPITPLVWFAPVFVWGTIHALRALGPWRSAPLFALGWFVFSLFQYGLHRFVFHGLLRHARTPTQRLWAFLLHGYHHLYPHDPSRLVMPPLVSWPMALLFAGAYWLWLGPERAIPALTGTLAGYLALFASHAYAHHARPRRGLGKRLRRRHLEHHHRDPDSRFGTTSPLWDVVFRTNG